MERIYKCTLCKRDIEDEVVIYKDKRFHKRCAELAKEKDEFYELVCELFHMKQPNPTIYNQVNNFFFKRPDYTYKGMSQALIYSQEQPIILMK